MDKWDLAYPTPNVGNKTPAPAFMGDARAASHTDDEESAEDGEESEDNEKKKKVGFRD